VKLTWYGRTIAESTWKDMVLRMRYVGAMLEADMKQSMKKGTGRAYAKGSAFTTRWSKSVGRSGARIGRKVKKSPSRRIWHIASSPGQPPAVDTGRLRASITWALSDGSGSKGGSKAQEGDVLSTPPASGKDLVLVVGTNVYYGKYLELGTRKMAARPFIRPSFNRNRQSIKSMLGGDVGVSAGAGGFSLASSRSGAWSSGE